MTTGGGVFAHKMMNHVVMLGASEMMSVTIEDLTKTSLVMTEDLDMTDDHHMPVGRSGDYYEIRKRQQEGKKHHKEEEYRQEI